MVNKLSQIHLLGDVLRALGLAQTRNQAMELTKTLTMGTATNGEGFPVLVALRPRTLDRGGNMPNKTQDAAVMISWTERMAYTLAVEDKERIINNRVHECQVGSFSQSFG
jgi:hypothetical protein